MNVQYIIVHCSATRIDHPYKVEQLERDHRARGMRSAGYHFYIPRDGIIIPLRPLNVVGRTPEVITAKALGYATKADCSATAPPVTPAP